MALQSPTSVDVVEIQFKLHNKFTIFNAGAQLRSNVNLLATASSQGLLLAGNPDAPELRVVILKDLVDTKTSGKKLHMRSVPLPNVPNAIACSADGRMLAVNYTLNGSPFLQIYSVPSFLTPNVQTLYNIRLSPEDNVFVLQLLWNPVLTGNIAVVLSNGALGMFTLKEGGQMEMHTMDKSHQVRCGCWSPKGKQIVLGFPNGRLQQFKPDLTLAKTIACPPNVHPGPFDTIALHWLSTFQFAVVFLQHGEDKSPSLYIVNAPKGGTPSYIDYYDICFSATGPRMHQLNFTHIQQWNLLLVTSANGVEVGILGTKESGETPTWVQYMLLDEARIEMPLTEANDETYPIGFAFDTSSAHQLTIGEQKIPVMPMVHVLSTHGHLVAFNFLNLMAGAADVCSPPPPVNDISGQFRSVETFLAPPGEELGGQETQATPAQGAGDMSFAFAPNSGTSTPALKDKSAPMFGALTSNVPPNVIAPTAPVGGSPFGGGQMASPAFSAPMTKPTAALPTAAVSNTPFGAPPGSGFAGFGGSTATSTPLYGVKPAAPLPVAAPQQQQPFQQQAAPKPAQKPNNDLSKPLYTVQPTFTAPAGDEISAAHAQKVAAQQKAPPKPQPQMNGDEMDEVVKQMIAVLVNSFTAELRHLSNQSKGLINNIGNPDEMKNSTKRLNDLQEIIEQANDRDFELDVQNLRHSLNESYAMLQECRTKLDMYNNPDITRLTCLYTFDPINRRQLAKLQSYLATNQAQMQQLQQQVDAQWSGYQDLVRRNSKTQMHIPCLDGIYQRMTKLNGLMTHHRTKLNHLKTKLKQKGLTCANINDGADSAPQAFAKSEKTIESLADSVLSMSLSHIVDTNRIKLSPEKLSVLRDYTRQRQNITIIKPQRPDRIGLRSEVILETKLQSERKAREGAANTLAKMQQDKLPTKPSSASAASEQQSHVPLAKPMATKPIMAPVQPQTTFAPPTQLQTSNSGFNFASASPFVKTSATAVSKSDDAPKPFSVNTTASSTFGTPTFGGFGGGGGGGTAAPPAISFGQPKPMSANKPESLKEALSLPPLQTPISFSAKVIGGDNVRSTTSATSTQQTPSVGASGFTTLSTSTMPSAKPTQATAVADKENKKPEDSSKPFSFSAAAEGGLTSGFGSGAPAFGGFSANNATTKGSFFDGKASGGFSFSGLGTSLNDSNTAQTNINSSAGVTAPQMANLNFASASMPAQTVTSSSINTGTVKPTPIFGGFNKPEELVITPVATTGTVSSTGASTTSGVATAANAQSTTSTSTPSVTTTTTAATVPSSGAVTPAVSSASDATDNLFGTLNICKPTVKEGDSEKASAATGNPFSGFGSSGSGAFSFTAAASESETSKAPSTTTSTTGFSFGNINTSFGVTTITPNAAGKFGSTAEPTKASPSPVATSTASAFSAISAAPTSNITTTTTATVAPAIPASTSVFASATATTTASTAGPALTTSTPAPATATSIFGGGSSFLNTTATSTPTAASPTSNIFAAAAAATSTAATPIFGSGTTTATSAPIFGTTTAAPASGNIFGGIPKPDQSVFSSASANVSQTSVSSTGGIFAAAAAANPSPFGGSASATNVSSGGSLFGGTGSAGFGTTAPTSPSGGSIFGGSATTTCPFAATGGSIFGGVAKPAEATGFFGGTQPTSPGAGSGGSLFGQNTFGQAAQTGGNLFTSPTAQQPTSPGFGTTGSIFGGGAAPATNATAGGNIFGGGANANVAPPFGSPTSSFGSAFSQPNTAPAFGSTGAAGGAFAQGSGASVAHTGFGSPQQSSAFAKPIFGGTATFGSPPAFGAQPAFGGAATFGSPKGFGTFAPPNVTAPTGGAFTSPTQKNNLFETLGSTDSGLSFGNLAQSTNANAPKPTFGGSSFMNYRA